MLLGKRQSRTRAVEKETRSRFFVSDVVFSGHVRREVVAGIEIHSTGLRCDRVVALTNFVWPITPGVKRLYLLMSGNSLERRFWVHTTTKRFRLWFSAFWQDKPPHPTTTHQNCDSTISACLSDDRRVQRRTPLAVLVFAAFGRCCWLWRKPSATQILLGFES